MEFIIDNKRIKEVGNCIDINKHIAIIGKEGYGKTTLLNKIIEEILEYGKETDIYILSEFEFEFNIDNEKVKIHTDDIREGLNTLKKYILTIVIMIHIRLS